MNTNTTSAYHHDTDVNSVANTGRTRLLRPLTVRLDDSPAESAPGVVGPLANSRRTRLA